MTGKAVKEQALAAMRIQVEGRGFEPVADALGAAVVALEPCVVLTEEEAAKVREALELLPVQWGSPAATFAKRLVAGEALALLTPDTGKLDPNPEIGMEC
jgi:hypothetical protein